MYDHKLYIRALAEELAGCLVDYVRPILRSDQVIDVREEFFLICKSFLQNGVKHSKHISHSAMHENPN